MDVFVLFSGDTVNGEKEEKGENKFQYKRLEYSVTW